MWKTADQGWGGDAYPGEEPETQAVNEQSQPQPERPRRDWTEQSVPDPAEYHNWVFINGHIVMDSERDAAQLVEDHGHTNLDKPLAYGRVAVQHRWTAHFQIDHTNISPYLVIKALKSYAKEQGWSDLAFVDHHAEELAPPKTANDVGTGWQTRPQDWTLDTRNPNSDQQDGEFHHNPGADAPRSGLYECPDCGLELDNYMDFRNHLMDEKSAQVPGADETIPDMDDVMPDGWNNSTSPDWVRIMSSEKPQTLDEANYRPAPGEKHICGNCAWLADQRCTMFKGEPQVKDQATCDEWQGHKTSAWDHPEPVPAEPGTTPIPPNHVRLYHYTNSYPSFEAIKQQGIKNQHAVGEQYGEPSQIWASTRQPPEHKAYFEFSMPSDDPRMDIGSFYPYTNEETGGKHTPETWAQYITRKGSDVTIPRGDIAPEEIIAAHEPWHNHYRYLQGMQERYPQDYEDALNSDWSTQPDIQDAVNRIKMERGHQARTAAPKVTPPGPIPFIFDIEQDRVYVGFPGEEVSDVNAGDYNPLGIVEGLYKPTGEVEITTQTNMPYTIRHMIQLWYYLHPELAVKSVVMVWQDGNKQKLASRPFDHRHSMALRPEDRDSWIEKNGPHMVHWTKPENVAEIMKNGIVPWNQQPGRDPNWGENMRTRNDHVYMMAPGENDVPDNDPVYSYPIHVDLRKLDPTKLKADEDQVNLNYQEWQPLMPEGTPRAPDFREWKDDNTNTIGQWAEDWGFDSPELTNKSLNPDSYISPNGGALAHEGTIPPEALSLPHGMPKNQKMTHTAAAPDNVGEKIREILKQDPSAVEVYDALAPLGNVYVVGGAIRDLALGLIPKDIDIMAQGISPEDVIKALKLRPGHVEVTGNQFPVIRYFHPSGEQCEVALPRREESTGGGGRKDFNVNMDINMPVEEDLERRDFTGNSMAVDLKTGKLIDPYGGWADLEAGKLSMVHPRAFQDDATRILRGLSSKSRHGLHPDPETKAAMSEFAHRIDTHVPNEQKSAELEKLLKGNDPASAMELAQETGVLKHILPEVADTYGFDQKSKYHNKLLFDHIMEVLRTTANLNKDPDVRMAALLHDIGKPGSQWFDDEGLGHYYEKHFKPDPVTGERQPSIGKDHEHHGADLARDRLKELTWGNGDRQKRVEHLVRSHMFDPFKDEKGARKFLNKYDPDGVGHAEDLMDIREADSGQKAEPWDGDSASQRALLKSVKEQGVATNLKGLALNGQDVMNILGLKPGKEVGEHLQRLQEIVLEEPALNTREDLTQALQARQARVIMSNVLDPIQETLDADVFDQADKAKPKVKPHIVEWVRQKVNSVLRSEWQDVIPHTHLVMTGSLTGYQWSHKSDFDVSVWFDYDQFPNLVRAEMIALMVTELDGTLVPGTTHVLQCYVVPSDVTPEDLYQPGLRSAYDLDKNKWIVAPERDRVYNPYTEIPALMGWIHDQAEKLKLLQDYDPPGAREFERQIHERRRRDQKEGKGDFSESNVLWKYLEHMELV